MLAVTNDLKACELFQKQQLVSEDAFFSSFALSGNFIRSLMNSQFNSFVKGVLN